MLCRTFLMITGLNTLSYRTIIINLVSLDWRRLTYLEVAVRTRNADSSLIANHLSSNHRQGLALSRVDLSRHNTTARLVLRKAQFTEATPGPGAKEADVVGDLHQRTCEDVQCTVSLDESIVGCKSLKLNAASVLFQTSWAFCAPCSVQF